MENFSQGYLLLFHLVVRSIRSSHDGKFRSTKHSKREMIQKVIGVSTGSSFVYIIVSKFGHVGIYDDKFRVAL